MLLKSQASQNDVHNMHGNKVKEMRHAKYHGVYLSRNGTTRSLLETYRFPAAVEIEDI